MILGASMLCLGAEHPSRLDYEPGVLSLQHLCDYTCDNVELKLNECCYLILYFGASNLQSG